MEEEPVLDSALSKVGKIAKVVTQHQLDNLPPKISWFSFDEIEKVKIKGKTSLKKDVR